MNENIEVRFGGSTADLDQASNKAANDIKRVSTAATAAQGPLGRLKTVFSGFVDGFKRGWREADAEIKATNNTINRVGTDAPGKLGGITAAIRGIAPAAITAAAAMAAIWAVMRVINWAGAFGDTAERLDQMAAKLGMAATEVSRWGALATTAGMSTDAFASSGQRLERAMVAAANGGRQQVAMFNELGISAEELQQGLGPTLMRIADQFKEMPDGPRKTAIAMGLMGRAGANMIPILNQGSTAIEEQMQLADRYGATASQSFMQAGLAMDNAMDEMTLATTGLQQMLFEALAPALVVCVELFNQMAMTMMDSYRSGGMVAQVLGVIGGALRAVVAVIATVIAGFQTLWHIAQAALRGIIGLVYSTGSALAALLSGDFSGIRDAWSNGMAGTGRAVNSALADAYATSRTYARNMQNLWRGPSGGTAAPGASEDMDLEIAGMGRSGGGGAGGGAASRAVEEGLRAEIEAINFRQEMAREDFAEQMRLQDEKLAMLRRFYGEDSREYQRELENKIRMQRNNAQEVVRIEQDRINAVTRLEQTQMDSESTLAGIRLEAARAHFDAMDQMGQVNNAQRIAALQDFADQEADLEVTHQTEMFDLKQRSILEQLELENLPLEDRRRLHQELEQAEAEHQARLSEIRLRAATVTSSLADRAAQQTLDQWQKNLAPITNSMSGFFTSMVTKSQSVGQALVQMGDQILSSLVQMGVQAAARWAAMELAKTTATTTGVAVRTAAEATGAATSGAISMSSALMQIANHAAVAAAGAYAAIASIPVVGPFLAPAAAAAALFGVYKLASSVMSAAGGDAEVQNDGAMYQLHKKEMVLPAKFASPLRDMLLSPRTSNFGATAGAAGAAARSEAGGRGGDLNFHYGPKHTNQNADLSDLLRRDGREMRKWLRNEVRNGALKGVVPA